MKGLGSYFLGMLLFCCSFSSAFALGVGERAPDFEATSTRGPIVLEKSLEGGPVVLALYYADFTPV
ncbi:hypothetical protein DESUT3_20190 [Desulfuromonas versatilis]|uniref:Alkyl hydroperoxide reductase subunit C/ Thiol specific antioxidant domain-containing protein n=1 Tax=Desulfuromonas versatilis TaxID=2802975 RepID=A0ABN6DY21_9BACT|nr:redoxin domain-containing protein [Desulfuromonas versatilis]BCR04950.1 hypothetical protein DESUT3_20190 [Desulfuromonas versatilis]